MSAVKVHKTADETQGVGRASLLSAWSAACQKKREMEDVKTSFQLWNVRLELASIGG